MRSNIGKIYLSNFLVGLVFWYGIEKLFMQSIGIDATGIGIVVAALLAFNFLFDIPSGILADRWSRKGTLMLAVVGMIICSLILGTAHSLGAYIIGYGIFYGVYVIGTSGTYQAIVYDSLHENGQAQEYSKIMGRAYALFLIGVGVANISSGFLATTFDFRMTYFITIIPCLINLFIIMSIKEPTFHKKEQKEKALTQLLTVTKLITRIKLLQVLAIILSAFTVIQVFKDSFGQLYILRYVSQPELLGIFWAIGAFTWAIGYLIAHHFRTRLNLLVIVSTLTLIAMSFIDSWFSLVLFAIQAVAMGALFNQIETRVQEETPSAVRASVLSVLSSLGRAVSVPASLIIGWIISTYDVFWALRAVTVVAVAALLYWSWQKYVSKIENEKTISSGTT